MAKKRYYAVRKGFVPGVYSTWDECKQQVNGYQGAEYKGFGNMASAQSYMDGVDVNKTFKPDESRPYAFVDGSFNSETNVYGYGGFLRYDGKEIIIQGNGNDKDMAAMRNVAGEIAGSLKAMDMASSHGLKSLDVYYDYQGIESWANGDWKAKNPFTQAYVNAVNEYRANGLDLNFIKVDGHTGVEGNEKADKLAKQAVGILPSDDTPIQKVSPSIDDLLDEMQEKMICWMMDPAGTKKTGRPLPDLSNIPDDEIERMAKDYEDNVLEYDSTTW